MYGTAAHWQHQHSQEGPKILGSFFQWILILQLLMDIFARCYLEMTRHWKSFWIVLVGRTHLPISYLHFYLVILILLKLQGVVFFFFLKEKVWRDMELERIIQDTLTHFIQSHIPAADLRYVEIGSSNIIVPAWTLHCHSVHCTEFCRFPVLCIALP